MAGFEVIIYGRFWVITEARDRHRNSGLAFPRSRNDAFESMLADELQHLCR